MTPAESSRGDAPHPFRARRVRLLVFDLDGTLLDSLPDIAKAVNGVRAAHGFAALGLDAVRDGVGAGARILVERTMADVIAAVSGGEAGPADPAAGVPGGAAAREQAVDALYGELLAQYRIHCAHAPAVYPGAREFLARAASRGVPLAVLTNKPLETAELTLASSGLRALFARVLAPENAGRKPDPAGLLALLREFGAEPGEAVLFGDSGIDFETGRAAGVFTVGLRGGYDHPGSIAPDLWADGWPAVIRWWDEGPGVS